MEKTPSKPLFTICVPSYNRGVMVLHMVRRILPEIAPDWELLILDNGSHVQVAEYQIIAQMAQDDPRVSYVRHSENRGFHGNYLSCFEHAQARHIMVISDEDFPNPAMIRDVLPELLAKPNLGILRGSLEPLPGNPRCNSFTHDSGFFSSGQEALLHYGLINNYVSGTIYNRELIQQQGLIERFREGVVKHRLYPHLYFELLIAARCDVATSAKTSCFEGLEQQFNGPGDGNPFRYDPPYSFGSRVDQMIILRDGIQEAVALVREPFDYNLFVTMYLHLCDKYFRLVSHVNMSLYYENGLHPGLLQKALLHVCAAGISIYPGLEPAADGIFALIAKIHAKYDLFPKK